MRSLTLAQVARILDCQGSFPTIEIRGYCTDSRLLQRGELFFALKGERVDGHAYLEEVWHKGAVAAVVSQDPQGGAGGLSVLVVEETLEALQRVARVSLAQCSTRVIAVTGSLGKTSTKEWIKKLLATKYIVAASPGNRNSQVGVPLAILNHSTGEEEILVLEMGMTLPGHLAKLVHIAPPDVSVITTVALVHACHFENLEEIAWAKGEIFSHPQTRLGILDRDILSFNKGSRLGQCSKISFSMTSLEADYGWDPGNPNVLEARIEEAKVCLGPFPFPGKHHCHNLLAAIAVARDFKIGWDDIRQTIPSLELPDRRGQYVRYGDILFVNDSYNAAELSIKAALECLPEPGTGGRKIAVLGSMMELGKFSHEAHRRVGEFALKHVECLYCLGEECLPMCDVWERAGCLVRFFNRRLDLVASLRKDLRPLDVVLIKGSRSKEMWKVLEELYPFHFNRGMGNAL